MMAYTGRLRRKVHERVGISLVEVCKRVQKSVTWVCERAQKGIQINFMALESRENVLFFEIDSFFKRQCIFSS